MNKNIIASSLSMRLLAAATLTCAAVLMPAAARAQVPAYTAMDLGTLGGSSSHATAINDAGQVAGLSMTADGSAHAFLWQGGVIRDLGTLPGDVESAAFGLNNHGQVVGRSARVPGAYAAVMWTDDGIVDLGRVGQCNCPEYITAYGINDDGVVAGESMRLHVGNVAFEWRQGVLTPLGATSTGNNSGAFAVSPAGDLGGFAAGQAAVWTHEDRLLLGTLGGGQSSAYAINEWGGVVGEAATDPDVFAAAHAFFWEAGSGMQDLGTLGGLLSRANAISGTVIVGESQVSDGSSHAFLYDLNGAGAPVDLNTLVAPGSGWLLTSAAAINAGGLIAGTGVAGGESHAVLLVPIER